MKYASLAKEIAELLEQKQHAYGDSFGKAGSIMRILYPDGVSIEALSDALTVVRVIDKLFRVATNKDAFGESPWRDIAGYAILAAERDSRTHVQSIKSLNRQENSNGDDDHQH